MSCPAPLWHGDLCAAMEIVITGHSCLHGLTNVSPMAACTASSSFGNVFASTKIRLVFQ
jgi:hypothetical protein